MATINKALLLQSEKLWLPEGNVLSDTHMMAINLSVIANQLPADDDIHFAEAVCKGLKAIALTNKAKFQVDEKGLKKDKSGGVELEFFEGATEDPWGDFIKTLPDLCPIIGYTGLNLGIGMSISPSDKFKITNEANNSNLVDLDISCPSTATDPDELTL